MKTIALKIWMIIEYIGEFILLLLGIRNNITINDPLLLIDDNDNSKLSPYISISSICINNKVSLSISCQRGLCFIINVDDIEVICNIKQSNTDNNDSNNNNEDISNNTNNINDKNNDSNGNSNSNNNTGWLVSFLNFLQISIQAKVSNVQLLFQMDEDINHVDISNNNTYNSNSNSNNSNNSNSSSNINLILGLKNLSFKSSNSNNNINFAFGSLLVDLESKFNKKEMLKVNGLEVDYVLSPTPSDTSRSHLVIPKNKMVVSLKELYLFIDMDPYNHYYLMKILTTFAHTNKSYDAIDDMYISRREQFFHLLDDIENENPWRFNDSYDTDEDDGSFYFLASDGIIATDNSIYVNDTLHPTPAVTFELVSIGISKISINVSTGTSNNMEIFSVNHVEANYESSNESSEFCEHFTVKVREVRGSSYLTVSALQTKQIPWLDLTIAFKSPSSNNAIKNGSIEAKVEPICLELDITALTALAGFASNIVSIFQSADIVLKSGTSKFYSPSSKSPILWDDIHLELTNSSLVLVDAVTSSMVGFTLNDVKFECRSGSQITHISSITVHVFTEEELPTHDETQTLGDLFEEIRKTDSCFKVTGLNLSVPQDPNNSNSSKFVDKLLNVDRLSSSDWSTWIDSLTSTVSPLKISISGISATISPKDVLSIGKVAGSLTSLFSIASINSSKYAYMIPYSVFYIYENHQVSSSLLKIDDIVITIHSQSFQNPNNDIHYNIHSGNILVSSKNVGTIASKTDMFLNNNVSIDYIDELHEKNFNMLTIDVTGCSNSTIPTIAQVRCPVENLISSDSIGIGYHASYTSIKLSEVAVTFEAKTLQPLFSLMSSFSHAKDDTYSRQIRINPHLEMHISSESVETTAIGNSILKRTLKKPNEVTLCHIDQTSIIFMHEFKHVIVLGNKNMEIGILQFGPGLSQVCGSLNSITMADMMLETAIHRNYLYDIDVERPSLIRFHMSSYYGQKPLIELDAERLRIMYLQRTTMTLINYFGDHLIGEIYKAYESQSTKPKVKKWKKPENIIQEAVTNAYGLFRLSAALRFIQGELPVSSSSTDSMIILGKRGEFFLSVEELPEGFCKGPLVDKGIWMSEMNNIIIATAGLRNEASGNHERLSWKLYQYAEQELVAPEINISPTQPFKIKFYVFDLIFSSWCTDNILGHNDRVDVIISVDSPEPPEFDGMYSGVLNSLDYKLDSTKVLNDVTRLQVDIIAENAVFTITQGHYTTLIYSIFENFCELNELVPPTWVLPVPKRVEVTHELWENGRECMDTRLPILSSVTVKVGSGLITAYENTPRYYDLVQRNLKIPCPFEGKDSAPTWGCHHVHRELHFHGMPSMEPGSHPDYYEFNAELFEVEMGTPLISILVDDFFIDFFRRHHGGGFGMESNTESLILLREDLDKGLHPTTLDFDEDHTKSKVTLYDHRYGNISQESIILVSKAQLNAWGVGIDSEKGSETKNGKKEKMISYRQRGVGNLRQCFIDIHDSVIVGHGDKILLACRFFGIPLSLTYARSVALMHLRTDMHWDMNWFIDFIVNIKDSILCFPEVTNNRFKGLCFNGDAKYTHAWRGFLDAGPGIASCSVTYDLASLFIAPIFSEEISLRDVESLLSPLFFELKMDYLTLSGKSNYLENNVELQKIMVFPAYSLLPGIYDVKPTCSRIWKVSLKSKNMDNDVISFNFSVQDIKFITTISNYQKELFKPVPIQPPVLSNLYPIGFQSFRDILHLPTLIYYHPHVPKKELKTFDGFYEYVDKHSVYFESEHMQFILHNNTYNLQISKAELMGIVYQYDNTNEQLNIQGAWHTLIWTHNEESDAWEPFLEKTKAVVITTTEKSDNDNENVSFISLRLKFDPIEISLSQRSIRNFLYLMSLADVVTSSSARLLPYSIINQLGTDVDCMLSIDNQEPIVAQLIANSSISLKKSEMKARKSDIVKGLLGKREKNDHSLAIKFQWNDQQYESTDYINIDKAGSFPLSVSKKRDDENLAQKLVALPMSVIATQDDVTPNIIVHIMINEDGAREISLRSVLCFKNNISRPIYLLIKYSDNSIEHYLNSDAEWSIPIKFAHPKAKLFCRLSKDDNWINALQSLSVCVQQGSFGTKLKAEVCTFSNNWSLLLKPEIREMSSAQNILSVIGVNMESSSNVALKFPVSSDRKSGATSPTNIESSDTDKSAVKLNDIYNTFFKSKSILSKLMKIHLLPPLQLCSMIPQPLFYRLAYSDGTIVAEGVLLIGEIINLHSLLFFESSVYISLRMVNYCWSKWSCLMDRQNPYNHADRETDITISLPSMEFGDHCMPPIEFSLLLQDQLLKISCPVIICNSTGIPLDFCESSAPQNYVKLMSSHSIDNIMSKNSIKNSISNRRLSETTTRRSSATQRPSISSGGLSNKTDTKELKSEKNISSDPDSSNAITLIIYMPFDHFNTCELLVYPDWTLEEVFDQVSLQLGINNNHRKISLYSFVSWENGKYGSAIITDPPVSDDSFFSQKRKSSNTLSFSPEKDGLGGSSPEFRGGSPEPEQAENSNFLSSKNLFSRISNVNIVSTNEDAGNDESIPSNMKLNMVATSYEVLPMTMTVLELESNHLRLCHQAELLLYKQIEGIVAIPKAIKRNEMMTMFNRKKFSYPTEKVTMEGLIPFNPKKVLFSSSMCIRAQHSWSESIDLLKAGLGGVAEHICVKEPVDNSTSNKNESVRKAYDFGVLIERGKSIFENISMVTIVPRFIISSKLSYDIDVKRCAANNESQHDLVGILSGTSVSFNFSSIPENLLEIRESHKQTSNDLSSSSMDEQEVSRWYGEIDITVLGIGYIKLRNKIVKIEVELVGASLIATFMEQENDRWPPYRLENHTSLNIRFCQQDSKESTSNAEVDGKARMRTHSGNDKSLKSSSNDPTITSSIFSTFINPLYANDGMNRSSNDGWELLPSRNIHPFYWDHPNTAEKSLRLEFAQGGQWEGIDIPLDEINLHKVMELHRALPELTNPIIEGYLMRKEFGQDMWVPIYCVLRAGTFYMFRNHEMDNFLGSINLLRQSGNELKTAAIYKMHQMKWNTTEHINATVTLSLFRNNKSDKNDRRHHDFSIDLNSARIVILKLAAVIGLFDDLIPNSEAPSLNNDEGMETHRNSKKEKEKKISMKAISVMPNNKLKQLLLSGYTVETLLEICSKKTFTDIQVVDAIIKLTRSNEKLSRKLCDDLLSDGLLIHCSKHVDNNSLNTNESNTSKLKSALLRQFSMSPRKQAMPYSFTIGVKREGLSSFSDENHTHHFKLCIPSFKSQENISSSSLDNNNVNSMSEFSIHLEETQFLFKSISSDENDKWVHKCYENVEQIWMKFCKGESIEKLDEKKDVFKIKVALRIRPDGPTKVLEIKEDEGYRENQGIVNSLFSSTKSPEKTTNAKTDESSESHLNKGGSNKSLSLFVSLDSFGISIIDAEPAELFYIVFSEIDISVDRSKNDIKFASTVQDIQVTCQLLRPVFPVTISPRRSKTESSRLMLPGLHRRGSQIPTLHMYFQLKIDDDDSISKYSNTKMKYFEMATLWLAPLQVDLDEEALVRFIRYSNEIKSNFNRYKELIKKNSGQLYNTQLPDLENFISLKTPNARALADSFSDFKLSVRRRYAQYEPGTQSRDVVYFGLLQLHPIDIIFTARASPSFPLSTTEMAITSLILQLDAANFRLNALIAENAYGSRTMIREIIIKHYRACIWRQIHKFLGGTDFVEGSVGLMTNLGTGVHDLFYEPIDGVLDDDKTFIDGLSKGGSSLASSTIRSIGGTTSISGNIAGGIGQGVSILTMDSEFYRKSVNRRVNKIDSVGDGVYSGSKDLGKNIVEGVSGIFESPLRGWESGGSFGFGIGVAQGLLGAAFKPAVGVFDFASKTAEGFRQTAIGDKDRGKFGVHKIHINRTRIPRAFGRNGLVLPYDTEKAAIQYVADKITDPRSNQRDSRLLVLFHLHIIRSFNSLQGPLSSASTDSSNFEPLIKDDEGYKDFSSITERWGMRDGNSYILMIASNRLVLAEVKNSNKSQSLDVEMVWSCPAACIDDVSIDARGDIVLTTSTAISNKGAWNRHIPTIQSKDIQDYYTFQAFLEQTVGVKVARKQMLTPKGGYIQRNILKTYASGLQSVLMSPTNHTYQVYGYCLYEYSKEALTIAGSLNPTALSDVTENLAKTARSSFTSTANLTNTIVKKEIKDMEESEKGLEPSEIRDGIDKKVCELYGKRNTFQDDRSSSEELPDGELSAVYPLVDVVVAGPFKEDNDRHYLTIANKGNKPMKYIFREEGASKEFVEGNKTTLKLSYASHKLALESKQQLEAHTMPPPRDIIFTSSVLPKKKRNMSIALRTLSGLGSVSSSIIPEENSIAGIVVIPTCGLDANTIGHLKIQIGLCLTSE